MAFTTPYENKTQLVGTSADTKPTGVDKYSLFLELDTLDIYYYGEDGWAKCGESGGGNNVYLLNESEQTGEYVNETRYLFELSQNSFDEEAITTLETLAGGGTHPTLTITCPELNIDGATLEWDADDEGWTTNEHNVAFYCYFDDDEYELYVVSESIGATITATITLSFPEPEA